MIRLIEIACAFMLVFSFTVKAQHHHDIFSVRTINHSLALSIQHKEGLQWHFRDYGEVLFSHKDSNLERYLFQGQEYSSDLEVYLFASRIYSAKNNRFIQPDPTSQYHSPYIFVGADPINYVDYDGNVGKSLILYQEEDGFPGRLAEDVQDLLPRAAGNHFYPLSDFVNMKIRKLPDWNGNVFIYSHMGDIEGGEVVMERIGAKGKFASATDLGKVIEFQDGSKELLYDSKVIGRQLHYLADSQGVPLKNVVAAGCNGEHAAAGMREGMEKMVRRSKVERGARTNFIGAKKGRYITVRGNNFMRKHGYKNTGRTIYHIERKLEEAPLTDAEKLQREAQIRNTSGTSEVPDFMRPTIEDRELREFMTNARIPNRVQPEFNISSIEY